MSDVSFPKYVPLVDLQLLYRFYPDQPKVPSLESLERLKSGDCVKVAVGSQGVKGGESFWVELIELSEEVMVGSIVNILVNTEYHGLSAQDMLLIQRHNVLAISE